MRRSIEIGANEGGNFTKSLFGLSWIRELSGATRREFLFDSWLTSRGYSDFIGAIYKYCEADRQRSAGVGKRRNLTRGRTWSRGGRVLTGGDALRRLRVAHTYGEKCVRPSKAACVPVLARALEVAEHEERRDFLTSPGGGDACRM